MFSSPYKRWLLRNYILNCVLCHLYWIRILDIFKFVPCSNAILQLDSDFPYFVLIVSLFGTTLGYDNRILMECLCTVGSCVHDELDQ